MGRPTHRLSGTELYKRWAQMKGRCYLPSYANYFKYGARGITACPEWKDDFLSFREWSLANGWMPGLSLDRIDGTKGYSPDNCRWVTRLAQSKNRRRRAAVQSGYHGVERMNSGWRAFVHVRGKKKHLGVYDNARDAALVHDDAAKKLKLETAMNFS